MATTLPPAVEPGGLSRPLNRRIQTPKRAPDQVANSESRHAPLGQVAAPGRRAARSARPRRRSGPPGCGSRSRVPSRSLRANAWSTSGPVDQLPCVGSWAVEASGPGVGPGCLAHPRARGGTILGKVAATVDGRSGIHARSSPRSGPIRRPARSSRGSSRPSAGGPVEGPRDPGAGRLRGGAGLNSPGRPPRARLSSRRGGLGEAMVDAVERAGRSPARGGPGRRPGR